MKLQAALMVLAFTAPVLAGCFGANPVDEGSGAAPADGAIDASRAVPPGDYDFDQGRAVVLEPGPFDILPLKKTYIASDADGVDIGIGVWLPDAPMDVKLPVIVDAGPYYGNNGPPMDARSGHLGRLVENYVPHGYAVAGVSVRGTGESGGCMDLMGPDEVADLSQAVTWLATQEWSNGNVGMVGKSYDGSTPWMVASAGNPHLKTIVPISGVPDVYELMYRNGTSEIRGPIVLNGLYYSFAVREQAPTPSTPDEAVRLAAHTIEGVACPDHVPGLTASVTAGATGERDPFGYWAERNLKPDVEENYQGSVLLVQGLQDWNVDPALSIPWAQQLNDSGLYVHQLLGQWGHSYPDDYDSPPDNPNMRWDWAERLLNWFDYWLKDDTTIDLGPPVQVLSADGTWRVDHSFPPHDTNWTTLHLATGEALAPEPGEAGSVLLAPQALPTSAASTLPEPRAYAADFVTPPMAADTHLSGLPKVHVTVVPQAPVGHVAAWLYDVGPDGAAEPIGWTMLNLRFADGGYDAQTVEPGEPIVARMEIQPLDAVLEKDHSILLRVWQYRDEIPGNEAQGRLLPATAPIELQYGADRHSVLELPIVDRGPDWFFEPPYPDA